MRSASGLSYVALLLLGASAASAEEAQPHRRVAVVVGANAAAPGREKLRYAYRDAEQMAQVLVSAGQFDESDVIVLKDPAPSDILNTVDQKLSLLKAADKESLFFFYYSGHADSQALLPRGQPLPLTELRKRLEDKSATVRVGVIDACRGGAWTRAKGLQPAEPFEVETPLAVSSEGSVLIASSSGDEDAHEAEGLQGSFFTHHLVAGMRGAADQSNDGQVTLSEAFSYAQSLTVRDSALYARAPQHPSFEMKLHGRSDVPVTRVAWSKTVVELQQAEGPLQVMQMPSGLVVLELPLGKREARVALAPGKYLVRRRSGNAVFAREIQVEPNRVTRVEEASLDLVGTPALSAKGASKLYRTQHTTLPARTVELSYSAGVAHVSSREWASPSGSTVSFLESTTENHMALDAQLTYAPTDRFQWLVLLPAFAYRLGERGQTEWVPWIGGTSWAIGSLGVDTHLGAGFAYRKWLSPESNLTFTQGFSSYGHFLDPEGMKNDVWFNTWWHSTTFGYSHTFSERVTVNLGVSATYLLFFEGRFVTEARESFQPGFSFALGSVQPVGFRTAPLVQLHVTDWLNIDGRAAVGFDTSSREVQVTDSYLIGATFNW